MQQFDYNEVLETILAKDSRYPLEAYQFVREGLDYTQHKMARMTGAKEPRHVTGRELTDGMRQYALETYGPTEILSIAILKKEEIFISLKMKSLYFC